MLNKTVYIELENVLCNYSGRVFQLKDELDIDNEKELPLNYCDIEPVDGAIEAYEELSTMMEVFIITPDEKRDEKTEWVRTHLPQAVEKIKFCNTANVRDGNYFVCSNSETGGNFRGRLIEFYSFDFPTWDDILTYITAKENGDEGTSSAFEEEEEESLARNLVKRDMVEKTIAALDAYMKMLNEMYDKEQTPETYKEIIATAKLTNKWLKVAGKSNESEDYDI